jgi:hypothetical protein
VRLLNLTLAVYILAYIISIFLQEMECEDACVIQAVIEVFL